MIIHPNTPKRLAAAAAAFVGVAAAFNCFNSAQATAIGGAIAAFAAIWEAGPSDAPPATDQKPS